jgi:hypothetical protein
MIVVPAVASSSINSYFLLLFSFLFILSLFSPHYHHQDVCITDSLLVLLSQQQQQEPETGALHSITSATTGANKIDRSDSDCLQEISKTDPFTGFVLCDTNTSDSSLPLSLHEIWNREILADEEEFAKYPHSHGKFWISSSAACVMPASLFSLVSSVSGGKGPSDTPVDILVDLPPLT